MKFVFFRFRRMEKMDSVMKGLMGWGNNFWARTAPVVFSPTTSIDTRLSLHMSSDISFSCHYRVYSVE